MIETTKKFASIIILMLLLCPVGSYADDGFLKRFKFNSINFQIDMNNYDYTKMPTFGWNTIYKTLTDEKLKDGLGRYMNIKSSNDKYISGYRDIEGVTPGQFTLSATFKYMNRKREFPQFETRIGVHINNIFLPTITYWNDSAHLYLNQSLTQFGVNIDGLFNSKPFGNMAIYIGGGIQSGFTIAQNNMLNYKDPGQNFSIPVITSNIFDQHGYALTGIKYNAGCKINLYGEFKLGSTFYQTHSKLIYRTNNLGITFGLRYKLFNKPPKRGDTFKKSPFWI